MIKQDKLSDFSREVNVRIVDPVSDSGWDRLVLSRSEFNFFHLSAWANVLSKTYGHKPYHLHFYRGSESLALVPVMEIVSAFTGRRGISMPFSDFCEPLVTDQWQSGGKLFETLLQLGRERKWRYFELRGGKEILPLAAVAGERYYGHELGLTGGCDRLFAGFDSSVRRAIRKATKNKLAVEISQSWKSMLDFYMLHAKTRKRHGVPPQPLSFFRNIYQEIIKADLGFVVLARHDLKPVASAVFFHSTQQALYKFGASDDRIQELRGNNLVMWEGIKELVRKGAGKLCFGRTSLDNEGLRKFKLSWGSQEKQIEYFRFALKRQRWLNSRSNAAEYHSQLFRRVPLALNRLAGALIYPHLD